MKFADICNRDLEMSLNYHQRENNFDVSGVDVIVRHSRFDLHHIKALSTALVDPETAPENISTIASRLRRLLKHCKDDSRGWKRISRQFTTTYFKGLVTILTTTTSPQVLYDVSWYLSDIIRSSFDAPQLALDADVIKVMVEVVLLDDDEDTRSKAICSIYNTSTEGEHFHAAIMSNPNTIPNLLYALERVNRRRIVKNGATLLAHLLGAYGYTPPWPIILKCLPTITYLLNFPDQAISKVALSILETIMGDGE